MQRAVALLFLCGLVFSEYHFVPIKFRNCKSAFDILSVEVSHCHDRESRCHFQKNSTPHIRITFKPNGHVDELEHEVRAKLGETYVPFHLRNKDACTGSNITCPLHEGQTYTYTQSVKILNEYPNVNVQVNWLVSNPAHKLHPGDHKREICVIFLAKVVD
ncbi:hypothetical protein QR680_018452 [Steinernema hermaphroditum]|uniref:MD-2-related lipid-recognition domain-containing protein n=1 Tax=Steinernema hermaphroditum TaxID=289476 RepID=A0AA39HI07_9BILA|nr:hypothetical protein QR680_018452 [Steinernema hermaphroditum]